MAHNGSFEQSYKQCLEVSELCPVEATVLGYTPNLGANVFFTAAFALAALATIGIGIWKKTWTFMVAVGCGAILEAIGYAGRVMMHPNAWDKDAFQIQICAIVLAPTIICAGIYLVIKHVALNLDPATSRVRPRWYPLFFLPADCSCLVVQAIGGGLAASAGSNNKALLDAGNRSIIAGICLQVVVLLLFGLVSGEYLVRVGAKVRRLGREEAVARGMGLWFEGRFRAFLVGVGGAYFAVFLRCIYRIAEMAGGWGNHIMQDEISFIVLDSTLMLTSVTLLAIFAPGIWFPQMAQPLGRNADEKAESPMGSSHGQTPTGNTTDMEAK